MVRPPVGPNQVVLVRFLRVEVENEHQFALFVNNNLVFFRGEGHVLVGVAHHPEHILPMVHGLIKGIQLAEAEALVILQVPLTAAEMVAVVVARPGKVDPLWMSEFIAHKVQVGLSAQTDGNESDQLV